MKPSGVAVAPQSAVKCAKRGGSRKGKPNKLTKSIKEAFEAAFKDLQDDSEANLPAWARAHPTEFYKLAAKLIPTTISGDPDNPINARVTVSFVGPAS